MPTKTDVPASWNDGTAKTAVVDFVTDSASAGSARPGGWLLVNPSHSDYAMASIDLRYRLAAVVNVGSGDYRATDRGLDSYLVPKRPIEVTPALTSSKATHVKMVPEDRSHNTARAASRRPTTS